MNTEDDTIRKLSQTPFGELWKQIEYSVQSNVIETELDIVRVLTEHGWKVDEYHTAVKNRFGIAFIGYD